MAEKPKAKAKPKPAPEEEREESREESPVDEAPARHTGRDPNQNDDEDLTFSIKGNRINIDLENDDRAPDTLRAIADLVDGI
jgi:outer membrane biosynthesis protein TonB